MIPTSDADDAVAVLLTRDVRTTLGPSCSHHVQAFADSSRHYIDQTDPWHAQHLVDETQQYFHDTRIDTTWPACPRHPNHPLWFRNGWWWCERDGIAVSKLGDLASRTASGGIA